MRDEFLAIASHELYTPVTSLQLLVQGLRTGTIPASPETLSRTFGVAERQTKKLTRLIDELLNVSRIQRSGLALKLATVDLAAVTREVTQRFEDELARAGSALVLHAEAPVRGLWDRDRLEQVVTNLVSNAAKFGAGKPIEITVEEAGGTARLIVTDHGIGIAPGRLSRIFDRFERAVSPRQYGGLGLGLYIVREIAQALGGSVRVESQVGLGSTFTLELPCEGPAGGRRDGQRDAQRGALSDAQRGALSDAQRGALSDAQRGGQRA